MGDWEGGGARKEMEPLPGERPRVSGWWGLVMGACTPDPRGASARGKGVEKDDVPSPHMCEKGGEGCCAIATYGEPPPLQYASYHSYAKTRVIYLVATEV